MLDRAWLSQRAARCVRAVWTRVQDSSFGHACSCVAYLGRTFVVGLARSTRRRLGVTDRRRVCTLVVCVAHATTVRWVATMLALRELVVVAARVARKGGVTAARDGFAWRACNSNARVHFAAETPVGVTIGMTGIGAVSVGAVQRIRLRAADEQEPSKESEPHQPAHAQVLLGFARSVECLALMHRCARLFDSWGLD